MRSRLERRRALSARTIRDELTHYLLGDQVLESVDEARRTAPGGDIARSLATAFHLPLLLALAFTAFAVAPAFFLPARQPTTTQNTAP